MARKSSVSTAPASTPDQAPITQSPSTILLDPSDWYLAPWRNLPPLPRPVPQPFDLKGCRTRLAKVNTKGSWHDWKWERANLTPTMSREEAHFWLVAMTSATSEKSKDLATRLSTQSFEGNLSAQDVRVLMTDNHLYTAWILIPLTNLIALTEIVEVHADGRKGNLGLPLTTTFMDIHLAETFARWILPYLNPDEKAALKNVVSPFLNPRKWNASMGPLFETYLAAMLGTNDELLAMVTALPDNHLSGYTANPSEQTRLLLGLADPRVMIHQLKRLQAPLNSPFVMRGWLANTELSGLEAIRDTIVGQTNKARAEELLAVFALVRAPDAAPVMLDLQIHSRAAESARKWLEDNQELAIQGLTPIASAKGKLAEAATRFLEDAKRKGDTPSTAPSTQEIATPQAASATPAWLTEALKATPASKAKLPPWSDPLVFPAIGSSEYTLTVDEVRILLSALRASTLAEPQPLVKALREHGDKQRLDAFAWKLYELWQDAGFPSKEKWAFLAVGHFGGNSSAMKLTPLIRAWPGQSQHARAVTGLEVLRAINTDVALMQLNGIAEKLKFQGLKATAQRFMADIAQKRGLTTEQLGDRVIPTLDLDPVEVLTFDFGPRKFRLTFDKDGKPAVIDERGEVKRDLPAPGKSDDATRATPAVESWKALKKQIKTVFDVQTTRLERAMVSGRRWAVDEFESLLVRHPLMTQLVRRLLWSGHPAKGEPSFFRVRDGSTYVNRDGTPYSLTGLAGVSLVHPLQVPEAERTAWHAVFEAEGLLPPFPQLKRAFYGVQPNERRQTELTRFAEAQIPSRSIKWALEKGGWSRQNADQGNIETSDLYFAGADLTATMGFDPDLLLGMDTGELHAISEVVFYRGRQPFGKQKPLPLEEVDPVVLSEVILFLTNLPQQPDS